MSPSRRLASSAPWMVWLAATLVGAASTSAQVDVFPDPLQRSPRLFGMGELTLAADVHNRITLWDFAGDPAGLMDVDSVSTVHVWPATSSQSAAHDIEGHRERQYVAVRQVRINYEAWRRTETSAYGFLGDVASFRLDRPFDDDTELRSEFQEPRVVGVLNGRMPYFHSDRMRYAIHLRHVGVTQVDEYRNIYVNGAGEYLGRPGTLEPPPDPVTPDEVRTTTYGGGASLSYRFGRWLNTAAGGDIASLRIRGENTSANHFTGIGEDRPYYTGQASLVGALGSFEYGATGHVWTSSSEVRFLFTQQLGIAQSFTLRGKLYSRAEDGREGRIKVRWAWDVLELGASSAAWFDEVDVTPGDPSSSNRSEERFSELALGANWRLAGRRGVIGAEFHRSRDRFEQTLSGVGPERESWDLRSGLEYVCTRVLTGRLGYIYRSDDRDETTLQNEYLSHTVTAGLGVAPQAAIWSVEAGYAIEWLQPDFVDPSVSRESRQRLALQVGWRF